MICLQCDIDSFPKRVVEHLFQHLNLTGPMTVLEMKSSNLAVSKKQETKSKNTKSTTKKLPPVLLGSS